MQVPIAILLILSFVMDISSAPVSADSSDQQSLQQSKKLRQLIQFTGKFNAHIYPEDTLNKLNMLQLIPVMIRQLQYDRIPPDVQATLHKVYGTLWKLIVDESLRRRRRKNVSHNGIDTVSSSAINPIMRSILRAQRVFEVATIFVHKNLADVLGQSKLPTVVSHGNAKEMHGIEPTDDVVLRVVGGANAELRRTKRNVLHELGDLNEGQRNALQALIGDDDNYDSYDDDDDNEIDIRHDAKVLENRHANYADYAFDVTAVGDDGDDMLRQMYGAPDYNDYDGSVSELFSLAASHNLRKQRNSDYLKANIDKFKGFLSRGELNGDDY